MEGSELEGAKNAAAEREKLGLAGLPASSMKPLTICFVQRGLIGETAAVAAENFRDFEENITRELAAASHPSFRSCRLIRFCQEVK